MPIPARTRKRQHVAHAQEFESTAHELLVAFRDELRARKGAKQISCQTLNGENGCETQSLSEDATCVSKSEAGTLFALTRAWDTALERLRILQCKPLPGSRRPTDPPPKIARPKNRLAIPSEPLVASERPKSGLTHPHSPQQANAGGSAAL